MSSQWRCRTPIREDGTRTRPLFVIKGFDNLDQIKPARPSRGARPPYSARCLGWMRRGSMEILAVAAVEASTAPKVFAGLSSSRGSSTMCRKVVRSGGAATGCR